MGDRGTGPRCMAAVGRRLGEIALPQSVRRRRVAVGGGPVGLGLAAELGVRGIHCLLVEQGDGTIYTPRANTVNSRTMEFCRRWGIADAVKNSGTPPGYPSDVVYLTTLQGHEIARIT